MSSLLHPYYLQQMGIPLWERRLAPGSSIPEVKLMILCEGQDCFQEEKQGILLRQMLFSIFLKESDVHLIPVLDTLSNEDLSLQMAKVLPKVILVLGNIVRPFQKSRADANVVPLIVSSHPKHLLMQGQDKKKAYQDWLQIKEYLSSL